MSPTNPKICAFTGHRSIPASDLKKLKILLPRLLDNLVSEGYTVFRAGGAYGFDMLAEEVVAGLKEKGRDVRLELMLPCRDQTAKWSKTNIERYESLLPVADSVHYEYDDYRRGCMMARNRRLIDGSDLCIAYLSKDSGGTANTVAYAQKNGVEVLSLKEVLDSFSYIS